MSSPIPSPEYVSEMINGSVYRFTDNTVLVVGDVPTTFAAQSPIATGMLIVRYGLTLIVPPGVVLIPGLLAAEKGGMLVGREAWDFLESNFTMHPRADILGMGVDGKPIQVLVREIDFGVAVKVYIYASKDAKIPMAEVTQLIIGNNAPPLPELLSRYLPNA